MRSKRIVKPTKIFDNSVNNTSKNKSKQKNASKKKDMFSNDRNDMVDLDGESDLENCNEIVGNGVEDVRVEECLDDSCSKSECNSNRMKKDNQESDDGRNKKEDNKSQRTYANMVTKDMKVVNNKLDFVHTVINEEGSEFVIFDETLVEKGSAQWKLTVCGHFVGYKMIVHELRYNIRRMWSKWGIDDIDMKADGTCMFKFRNEEGITNSEGISALASSLGRPLIMDNMTARRCQFGEGRLDYARMVKTGYRDLFNKGLTDEIKEEEKKKQNMEESRRRPYFGNRMGNRKFVDRRQNKDGRSYNIGGRRNEAKNSKGDVWKKKEGKEEGNNRQENKDQVNGKKSQNEDVVKTSNKYDALNGLEDDNEELEILKGRMIVDTFLVKEM
ncbi:hypothetical protein Tco_0558142 [Tanacetum coccineum]